MNAKLRRCLLTAFQNGAAEGLAAVLQPDQISTSRAQESSIPLFYTMENSQLERVSAARRHRHKFIDWRTLMLVRALVGHLACRKRKLLFTQANGVVHE
jgi:hypothetical protein